MRLHAAPATASYQVRFGPPEIRVASPRWLSRRTSPRAVDDVAARSGPDHRFFAAERAFSSSACSVLKSPPTDPVPLEPRSPGQRMPPATSRPCRSLSSLVVTKKPMVAVATTNVPIPTQSIDSSISDAFIVRGRTASSWPQLAPSSPASGSAQYPASLARSASWRPSDRGRHHRRLSRPHRHHAALRPHQLTTPRIA